MRITSKLLVLSVVISLIPLLLLFNIISFSTHEHGAIRPTEASVISSKADTISSSLEIPPLNSRQIVKRRRKKILIYTPLFGVSPWPYILPNYNFTDGEKNPCEVSDCEVTYDKRQLPSSDLVVFYGRDLPSLQHLREVSKTSRPAKQVWLYYMHESPIYTHFRTDLFGGIFNWTASYRADSDIVVTYHGYKVLTDADARPKKDENFASGRSKLITWMNSHCDDDRLRFVHKLREHLQLDVYGHCSKKFKPQTPDCPRSSQKCTDMQKQYKFFLAFENSFCTDYITEKYWLNGLNNTLVPVVFGKGNYKDERIAIPGSFIDVRDFKTIKDLANHLHYLDQNDTAYNEFHQWRYKYRLYTGHCMCSFCDAIQNFNLPSKTLNMDEFWGKRTCDLNKTPLKEIMKNSS